MKYKICLHGLNVKNKGQLLESVKKALPLTAVKTKVKEKYLPDNDFIKYKSMKFRYLDSKEVRITCLFGVMIIRDRLWQLNEVLVEYTDDKKWLADKVIKKLLAGKIKFVIEEPDLLMRAKNLRGEFKLSSQPFYDADDIGTVLKVHLPWQLYDVSRLWGSLLLQPEDKTLVRQLRVKLRRLRSSLVLFKPLLEEAKAEELKALFKGWTDILGNAREFDVALMTCQKIRRSQNMEQPMGLEDILQEYRRKVSKKVLNISNINAVTGMIAQIILYLYDANVQKEYSELRLKAFVRQRLSDWIDRLLELPVDYSGENMEELHRVRIKVKRFRYALQAIPEITVTSQLLRSLKNLQDMLGLLHDNYINDKLIAEIMQKNGNDSALRYEGAMFCGWDSARREAVLAGLPEVWDNFSCCVRQWQEEYL